jgi:outer membrane protein assembly factor BamA
VLPELGYDPETGPLVGAKYTHRNFDSAGTTLDVEVNAALNRQLFTDVTVGNPHLASDRLVALGHFRFALDPQRQFFGLGNNRVGPDPVSTHESQTVGASFIFGWRPTPHLALDLTTDVRDVRIRHGDRFDSHTPQTIDAFPGLPGIDGGHVTPFGVSLVWNSYDDLVRPTRGWRVIAKVVHADSALLSDFDFTRETLDVGYLYPILGGNQVFAIRGDGAFMQGPRSGLPFWELLELGGNDTLRGFFPYRFLGTARALLTGEWRVLLTQFDFRDWWHVRLDGVVFAEGGRVYIDRSALAGEFGQNSTVTRQITNEFRYSGGGGLRIALSQALVARIDVGFSEESQALVYLSFGQTF